MFPKPDVVAKEAAVVLRTLGRERAFSLLSVFLLALGIGLVSAVFTLIWQVIYAQLPVEQPSQIYTFTSNVTHAGREDSDANAQTFSLPAYRYLAIHFKATAGVIARTGELANLDTPDGPRHLKVDFVSGNFFPVLGIRAAIGTTLSDHNDATSGDRFTAMLAYQFWQESFGGQPNVWNGIIRVNGIPFRIVGVTPPGFGGLIAGQVPKLYLPVAAYADVNPGWHAENNWSVRWLNAFVRLPASVSRQNAEAQLQPVYRAAVRQELTSGGAASPAYLRELAHEFLSLIPASQGVHSNVDSWMAPLKILQWMTVAILVLACINVAGLAIVRALKQKGEILIRFAAGATRPAVMRLHFLQTLILSFAGGLLGLLVAHWTVRLLVHLAHLDYNGFLYRSSAWTIAGHWSVVLVTGLLVGVLPAWQATRVDLAAGLNEGALTHSATRSQVFARRSLAGAQIALSLVLTIAATLFAKSLYRTLSVPVGFNASHLSVFAIDPKLSGNTLPAVKLLFTNLADHLQTTPGVTYVTYGTGGPFPQEMDVALIDSTAAFIHHQSATRNSIAPRYFSTFGIPLRAGREFDARDTAASPKTIILSESLAHKLFKNENPLGRTVTLFNGLEPNWLATVVGVAADYHQSWRRAGGFVLYTPAQQITSPRLMTYYVRTAGPAIPEQQIRRLVREQAPSLAAFDIATMQSRMSAFASTERALAVLIGAFAVLALIISLVGVYGVVSYGASLRVAEFGVRIAVGATPSHITWIVLREAVLILTNGLLLAAPLTYFCLKLIGHQLNGISLRDPTIYLAVAALLAACSLLAALWPAHRATRTSVGTALRKY